MIRVSTKRRILALRPRRWIPFAIAVVGLGILGCDRDIRPAPESDLRQAQISVYNATHDVIPLRVQSINSNYRVSCDLVGEAPSRYLGEEHLSSGTEELIYSGVERSLRLDQEPSESTPTVSDQCHFSFVTTPDDRLRAIAAVWPRNLPEKIFYTDVDAPVDVDPEPEALIIEAGYGNVADEDLRPWRHRPCGVNFDTCSEEQLQSVTTPPEGAWYYWSILGQYPEDSTWSPVDLSSMAIDDHDRDGCVSGRGNTPLTWDDPPSGVWRATDVDAFTKTMIDEEELPEEEEIGQAPSEWDCHEVSMVQNESTRTWSFCGSQRVARQIRSDEKQGEVFLEFFSENQYGSPASAYEALTIGIERRTHDGELFEIETIDLIRGHGIPEHLGIDWEAALQSQCNPRREIADCNQIVAPIHLEIDTPGGQLNVIPGETYFLDPTIQRRVEYVRGMYRIVSDLRCQDERVGPDRLTHSGPYLELVYYGGLSLVGDEQ